MHKRIKTTNKQKKEKAKAQILFEIRKVSEKIDKLCIHLKKCGKN